MSTLHRDMKSNLFGNGEKLSAEVGSFFDYSRQSSAKVCELVNSLLENEQNNVFVFGGMIRDIGLFSVDRFDSDIDLVFSGSELDLYEALSKLDVGKVTSNKFGGNRLNLDIWDVDIWCDKHTWAFEEKHIEFKSIMDLLDTTLMSWDSALYNIRTQQLLVKDDYLDNLRKRHLDLVLEQTPNEIGAFVRLLRTILNKDVQSVSQRILNSINSYYSKFDVHEVIEYEMESFKSNTLSIKKINLLSHIVERNIKELNDYSIEKKYYINLYEKD